MDIYKQLGVKTYINAHDTYTLYGGSRMAEGVLAAMNAAAKHYVDINELQEAVGKEIARLTGNEAAYLTNGSSAALLISAAVCIAGDDAEIFENLPLYRGSRNEIVVMEGQLNPFWNAMISAGGKLISVGNSSFASAEDIEAAITENTAAIFYFAEDRLAARVAPFPALVEIAKKAGVPLVVDAAAQLPPVENLRYFTRMGADMVIFSGGKMLSGPQCGGLIFGTAEMIERCKKYGFPNHGVGRSSKIGKEEMLGLYAAVKNFVERDWDNYYKEKRALCERLAEAIDSTGIMRSEIVGAGPVGQSFPMAYGHVAEGYSSCELQRLMKEEGIYIGAKENAIFLNPSDLNSAEMETVIRVLKHCASIIRSK